MPRRSALRRDPLPRVRRRPRPLQAPGSTRTHNNHAFCWFCRDYGLDERLEWGGDHAGGWFSSRPMHCPVLAPVHGMPFTSGSWTPPQRRHRTHPPSASCRPPRWAPSPGRTHRCTGPRFRPAGHDVSAAATGMAISVAAGAAAIATANPPARTNRRAEVKSMGIVRLSLEATRAGYYRSSVGKVVWHAQECRNRVNWRHLTLSVHISVGLLGIVLKRFRFRSASRAPAPAA